MYFLPREHWDNSSTGMKQHHLQLLNLNKCVNQTFTKNFKWDKKYDVYYICPVSSIFDPFPKLESVQTEVSKLKTSNWTGLIHSIITRVDGSLCTCCFKRFISAALGSRLTIGLFLILRALSAYRSVLMVSSMFESAGLTQAIINVWLLPPKESDETNTESSQKQFCRSFCSHSLCWIIEIWLVLMHFNHCCCHFCVKQQFCK